MDGEWEKKLVMFLFICTLHIMEESQRLQSTQLHLLVYVMAVLNSTPPLASVVEDTSEEVRRILDVLESDSDDDEEGLRTAKRRRFWMEYKGRKGLYENFVIGAWPANAAGELLKLGEGADLAYMNEKYKQFFRVDFTGFMKLYVIVQSVLVKEDTIMRESIPGEKKLCIFLYWLAHANTNDVLSHLWVVSTAAIYFFKLATLNKLCEAEGFVSTMIRFPRLGDLLPVMDGFADLASLPGCCGAMDGTFVKMPCPKGDDSASYHCYKGYNAILVLAVVDSNGRFMYVDANNGGAVGDATVFSGSLLKQRMDDGTYLSLPPDAHVHTKHGAEIQPYLLGDSAFALSKNMMKCYQSKTVTLKEMHFNYACIRTRRVVECAFGRLKARWRIMSGTTVRAPYTVACMTLVCAALHNFCQDNLIGSSLALEPFEPSTMLGNSQHAGDIPRGSIGQREALAEHVLEVLDLVPASLRAASQHYVLVRPHGPVTGVEDIEVLGRREQGRRERGEAGVVGV
jgi:hypothetical protein